MDLTTARPAQLMAAIFIAGTAAASAESGRFYDPSKGRSYDYTAQRSRGTGKAVKYQVQKRYRRQNVSLRTKEKRGTIIIDPRRKYLYYVTGTNRAIRYGVGVGRQGFGWAGKVRIGRKAAWPSWHPPKEMRQREPHLPISMVGGIKNPLGARALYLYDGRKDTLYRIHGTNEPWTIGRNVSSGCIRMTNGDVIDLYKKARVGAKVVVLSNSLIPPGLKRRVAELLN
jgi:lipoprotein-anchoring transpeptidase ErfK/SrfK